MPPDPPDMPLMATIHCAGIPRQHAKGRCERPIAEVYRLIGSADPLLVIHVVEVASRWSGRMRKPKTIHRGRRQALVGADFTGGTGILLCPRGGPKDANGAASPNLHNAWYEPDSHDPEHYRRRLGGMRFDFELLRPVYYTWQLEGRPQKLRWSPASVSPIQSTKTLEGQFSSGLPSYPRGEEGL